MEHSMMLTYILQEIMFIHSITMVVNAHGDLYIDAVSLYILAPVYHKQIQM